MGGGGPHLEDEQVQGGPLHQRVGQEVEEALHLQGGVALVQGPGQLGHGTEPGGHSGHVPLHLLLVPGGLQVVQDHVRHDVEAQRGHVPEQAHTQSTSPTHDGGRSDNQMACWGG